MKTKRYSLRFIPMRFLRFGLRTGVGFLAILLGAAVTGQGQGFLTLFFLSVICTGGVGLVIWIPACYAIGLLLTFWFLPFDSTSPQDKTRRYLQLTKDQVALASYVKRCQTRGQPTDDILRSLANSNWTTGQIAEAFQHAKELL